MWSQFFYENAKEIEDSKRKKNILRFSHTFLASLRSKKHLQINYSKYC